MNETTLNWSRHVNGFYQATAPNGDYYRIRRCSDPRRGERVWEVAVWRADSKNAPPANPDVIRGGFSKLDLAKAAAESTRCVRCSRARMLGGLSQIVGSNRTYPSFCCVNDKQTCRRLQLAADEQETAEREAMLMRKDHNVFEVRETQYGPDLVIGSTWENPWNGATDGSSTVVSCTDADLLRIETMLRERREARNRASAAETIERLHGRRTLTVTRPELRSQNPGPEAPELPLDISTTPASSGPPWDWPQEGDDGGSAGTDQ